MHGHTFDVRSEEEHPESSSQSLLSKAARSYEEEMRTANHRSVQKTSAAD